MSRLMTSILVVLSGITVMRITDSSGLEHIMQAVFALVMTIIGATCMIRDDLLEYLRDEKKKEAEAP